MTRTDVMASSRPRTAGAAPKRRGSGISRRLLLLPVVLLTAMALVGPSVALAAEGTSGYGQTPTVTETKPSTGTSPSKETSSPKSSGKETEPTSTSSPTTTESEKTGTLPFTGFDLRWSVGVGLLLMAAGFSIVFAQRRQRREQ